MYDQNIQTGRRVCCGNSYYTSYRSPHTAARRKRYHSASRIWMAFAVVLISGFLAVILTARTAEAGKEEKLLFKYYDAVEADRGDTLWTIAEDMLNDPETASKYNNIYSYMDEVMTINGLFDTDSLEAGEPLILPYYSSEYKD